MTRTAGRPALTGRGCRCGLPIDPPDGRHWMPSSDPDPGPEVAAVALHGRDPAILRSERLAGEWRSRGAAATHPDEDSPPRPWQALGRCWDGHEHPVVDVTSSLRLLRVQREHQPPAGSSRRR